MKPPNIGQCGHILEYSNAEYQYGKENSHFEILNDEGESYIVSFFPMQVLFFLGENNTTMERNWHPAEKSPHRFRSKEHGRLFSFCNFKKFSNVNYFIIIRVYLDSTF